MVICNSCYMLMFFWSTRSQNEMLGYLRNISVSSSKLLLVAKALSADPNTPNTMNQLAAAARTLTDAINSLLNLWSSSGPGQKECDNALRNIEAVAPVLDNPNEPVSELSYFDCLDMVIEKSKVRLGRRICTYVPTCIRMYMCTYMTYIRDVRPYIHK